MLFVLYNFPPFPVLYFCTIRLNAVDPKAVPGLLPQRDRQLTCPMGYMTNIFHVLISFFIQLNAVDPEAVPGLLPQRDRQLTCPMGYMTNIFHVLIFFFIQLNAVGSKAVLGLLPQQDRQLTCPMHPDVKEAFPTWGCNFIPEGLHPKSFRGVFGHNTNIFATMHPEKYTVRPHSKGMQTPRIAVFLCQLMLLLITSTSVLYMNGRSC
jgi:hypothetical protein